MNKEIVIETINSLLSQAANGIELFHSLNYGLRDFKDDNILIRRRENYKLEIVLCDFGMSCHLD